MLYRIVRKPKVALVTLFLAAVMGALIIGGFVFPRTVVTEPTQVISLVEMSTTIQQVVASFSASNIVGGIDGTTAWGYALGTRNANDTVTIKLGSVYDVYVCLALRNNTLPDLLYMSDKASLYLKPLKNYYDALVGSEIPIYAVDCNERRLLKSGEVYFTIPARGNYSLVIGKAAGYLVSSFNIDVIINESKEVLVTRTTTVTILTTRTL